MSQVMSVGQPGESYEIRFFRPTMLLYVLAGLFFLLAGLEIGWFHKIIPAFDITPEKKWIFWLFELFFVGCGGLIVVNCFFYVFVPPTLLKADEQGIRFATGLRYTPFLISWKYFKSVSLGVDPTMLAANQKVNAGLQIDFEKSNEIPMGKATSIGVSYFLHKLTINWFMMNRPASEAVETIRKLAAKYRPAS